MNAGIPSSLVLSCSQEADLQPTSTLNPGGQNAGAVTEDKHILCSGRLNHFVDKQRCCSHTGAHAHTRQQDLRLPSPTLAEAGDNLANSCTAKGMAEGNRPACSACHQYHVGRTEGPMFSHLSDSSLTSPDQVCHGSRLPWMQRLR